MKTTITSILIFCAFSLTAQNAREISRNATNATEVGDMEMISTINIYDAKGNVRTRQISTASRKFAECTKMLIRFLAPADVKGTALLVYDYDDQDDSQWIFIPALRKVRRIVSAEKGKNFMGSEFTNADMSRPNQQDFDYQLIGETTLEGRKCWRVKATGKTDALKQQNGFSSNISYIDQQTFLCYKIEYFDMSDKLHRIQYITDYKKQANGKYFAYRMTMQNVQNNRKSEMIVDKFQSGSKLPEHTFSPAVLDK